MSKNFELMQRAGKLLDIEVPRAESSDTRPSDASVAPALRPMLLPTLAPAPAAPRVTRWRTGRRSIRSGADQMACEESQRLVQQIFVSQAEEPPRVVVFAGIDHGNGCSGICARTAEALRRNLRGSICLVEGNLHSPSLHRLYDTSNHRGLTDALLHEGPIRSFATPVQGENVYLLSCGSVTGNFQGLLNSSRLECRFRDLRNEFDFVVVDAPPIARYSEAFSLAKVSDGLVMVLEANSTRRESAARVTEHLRASQIRILAAVLNKRTFPIPESLYRRL